MRRKATTQSERERSADGRPLGDLARLFLRLGLTAFGGPAAHIAMMEEEVVHHRAWVTHEDFLDMLGATNLIPGPNSTEMAIHIGYRKAGVRGLALAGVCFILPATLITLALAALYVRFGTLPDVEPFMRGIRCAIIAVIIGAVVRIGRPIARSPFGLIASASVAVLSVAHFDEIALLLASGVCGIAWAHRETLREIARSNFSLALLPLTAYVPGIASSPAGEPPTLVGLVLFFLKIGSILYGSGYVLVAFLQEGLIDSRSWLTQSALLDAVAVGQFTPGPVLSTATFIGYLLFGIPGAFLCTLAIFFPSFLFVLAVGPLIPKLRKSPGARGFLDGVNAASIGLMIGVCFTLGRSALLGWGAWGVFLGALVVSLRYRVNAAWIVAAAALAGWALGALHARW